MPTTTTFTRQLRHAACAALATGLLIATAPAAATAYAAYTIFGFSDDMVSGHEGPAPSFASVSDSRGGNDGGSSWSYVASASASLSSGSLRADIQTTTVNHRGFAVMNASLSDTLTFGIIGGGPREVTFTLAVEGAFHSAANTGTFDATGYLNFGSAESYGVMQCCAGPDVITLNQTHGETRLVSHDPGNAIAWFTVRQMVLSGVPIGLYTSLTLGAGGGPTDIMHADFQHTAQLWITLPPDTTFTSESGVFMQDAPPVPEPRTAALLLGGLAWLAGLARFRAATSRPR